VSKRNEKVIKCGRCGNWVPISQWKYTLLRIIHDGCSALPAKVLEAPGGKVLRRRGGVVRELR
jgi:hypothetical protein